jgi:hypothetical protein
MRVLVATLVIFFAGLLAGCDSQQESYVEQVVVEAYLVGGEPLPEVLLSRTGRLANAFNFDERAVRGADVSISLLATDGSVEERYVLSEFAPGRYSVAGAAPTVLPVRTYRFEAVVAGFEAPVRAQTIIPDTFVVVRAPPDTVTYQQGASPEVTLTRSIAEGRQTFYVITTEALDISQGFTPFLASRDDLNPEEFVLGSSPPIGENTYPVNADGTISVRTPWLGFRFYGPNRIATHALDENLYDFIRSRSAQFGFSTISPGEIQNVITHIENGTGVFASFSRASVDVFIRPRP